MTFLPLYQVIVGTTTGQVALFDFRQRTKGMFRKFSASAGSVRAIDCNTDNGYFACVGLDR